MDCFVRVTNIGAEDLMINDDGVVAAAQQQSKQQQSARARWLHDEDR